MTDSRWPCSAAQVFARPAADQIWLGPTQRAALGRLCRAPESSVRLLIGPRSSGKSTLLEHWTTQFDRAVVLRCRGSHADAASLLAALLESAGFGPWGLSETDQRNLLTLFVRQRSGQHRKVVVLIERGDRLGAEALRELDRLAGVLVDGEPALDLYASGSQPLLDRLKKGTGWVAEHWYCCPVGAVSAADTADYIAWRLSRCGLRENLFTTRATEHIAHLSEGRFVDINVLCQMALMLVGSSSPTKQIGVELVGRAATELLGRARRRRAAAHAPLPSALEAPGYLLVTLGGRVVSRTALQPKILFGSSHDCDLRLPGPSRRHHGVVLRNGRSYELIELPGGRGLSLNGRAVTRAWLTDRDVIKVGAYELVFVSPHEAPGLELPFSRPETDAVGAPRRLRVVK